MNQSSLFLCSKPNTARFTNFKTEKNRPFTAQPEMRLLTAGKAEGHRVTSGNKTTLSLQTCGTQNPPGATELTAACPSVHTPPPQLYCCHFPHLVFSLLLCMFRVLLAGFCGCRPNSYCSIQSHSHTCKYF